MDLRPKKQLRFHISHTVTKKKKHSKPDFDGGRVPAKHDKKTRGKPR